MICCATHVIHVWRFRCIACIEHGYSTCIYYINNTYIDQGYTPSYTYNSTHVLHA